jgi:ligand-binding sensor domain-containing protein/two-component sensor histidine kinase
MDHILSSLRSRTKLVSGNFWATTLCVSVICLLISQSTLVYSEPANHVVIAKSPISELMSQHTVNSIKRDSTGFLWIGTQQGLYKYDGNIITSYSPHSDIEPRFPSSDIREIIVTHEDDLLIATFGKGIIRYNHLTDDFSPLFDEEITDRLFVTTLMEASDGNIWYGTKDGRIRLFSTQESRHLEWLENDSRISNGGQPLAIIEVSPGHIWVASSKQIYYIEAKTREISLYSGPMEGIGQAASINTMRKAPDGSLWVGTETGNLHQIDPETKTYEVANRLSELNLGSIKDISFNYDAIWLATDQGLIRVQLDPFEKSEFTTSNSSLSNNHISTLFQDGGTLWIGTYFGLNLLVRSPFELLNKVNSGVDNEVLSFSEDRNGEIWISTYNGLYIFDEQQRSHRDFDSILDNSAILDRRVMSVSIRDNQVWIGFRYNGLQIYNLMDASEAELLSANLPNSAITTFLHTEDLGTWIGTYNNGLFRYKNNAFHHYDSSNPSLPSQSITALYRLNNEKILVGGEGGAVIYETSTDSFSPLTLSAKGTPIYPTIFSFSKSANGTFWMGTKDHGLFIGSSSSKSKDIEFQPLNLKEDNFENMTAYAIETDDSNTAWVSTSNGLFNVDSDGTILSRFTTAEGLQGNEFNFGASFKDSKGRLYFGGSNGYNRFHPSDINLDSSPPAVVLTDISIAGIYPTLPVALHDLELIELAHEDYFITLFFSALDYLDPEKNQFSYKLENFDPEWIDNQTRNSATYTNLPPGEYVFRVRGANSAGVWNMEGASIGIRVLPPWWRTWWAYSIYVCLFTILGYYSKRSYDRRVIYKRATAMAEEMRRVTDIANDDLQEQLEDQDKLLNNVYVHNLSTLALVKRILASAEAAPDSTDAFNSTQRRIDVLTLLEECVFYHGESIYADMEKCTNLILERCLKTATVAAESITTINEIGKNAAPIETATILATIVFELVENCMQHAFEAGSLSNFVHITMDSSYREETQTEEIILKVKDNGVGIPESILANPFDTQGFMIIRALAETLDGSFDLSCSDGTLASVTLPSSPALLPPIGAVPRSRA